MLFNSFIFILCFLPAALLGYFLLNRYRFTVAGKAYLLFASLFFFSYWNISYLPLILASILFNYSVGGLLIGEGGRKRFFTRKQVLFFGIAVNLAFLGYYKYTDFLLGNLNQLFDSHLPLLKVALPLGISFFTITQIAFLVDAYEGLVEENDLLNYALFVTFFPHLLAGPILHHKEMMPQFDMARNKLFNYRNVSRGVLLFSIGLFKKVVIADYMAKYATAGFDASHQLNLIEAWTASLSYTLQLYMDFSGYTDMAVGIGLMFNINLPVNFNSPYKATSIIDFWKRWHMTLTAFINTYIYSVILRSFRRVTFWKSMLAIFVAMFISGVWHGAGWTFIAWGSMHAAALVANHVWKSKLKLKMNRAVAWLVTFNFVNASFVFFRAKDIERALQVLKGMLGGNGVVLPQSLETRLAALKGAGLQFGSFLAGINGERNTLPILMALLLFVLLLRNSNEILERFVPDWRHAAFAGFVMVAGILNITKLSEFLYFNF